ncbi:Fc.00g065930.m01.CDS01 [Cosmosporella sp. VM-42]
MPLHQGLIPREGFCADVVLRLLRQTALNPALLLPLVLLARFTKRGGDLSILHPTAFRRLKTLFWIAVARAASNWYSDKIRNNWVDDTYFWPKEVALITGGADGIGGRIVKLLEERGVTVVVLDIQPMSFAVSSKVYYFQCDIRSPESVAEVAEKVRAQVGNPTVLINNAGVARGRTVLDARPGDVRFTFEVNTLAHYWILQNFLPSMVDKNHGMVVTVTSYAAWTPIPNMVDYGASKAASMALHEGLTAELATRHKAPKIRTILVHPGHTKTALFTGYDQKSDFMVPHLEPESVADAVVKQMLTGRSGKVVLPETGLWLSALRCLPDWYVVPLRAQAESYMTNFRGRQVVEDVDASYNEDGARRGQNDTSESTVLVSEV